MTFQVKYLHKSDVVTGFKLKWGRGKEMIVFLKQSVWVNKREVQKRMEEEYLIQSTIFKSSFI